MGYPMYNKGDRIAVNPFPEDVTRGWSLPAKEAISNTEVTFMTVESVVIFNECSPLYYVEENKYFWEESEIDHEQSLALNKVTPKKEAPIDLYSEVLSILNTDEINRDKAKSIVKLVDQHISEEFLKIIMELQNRHKQDCSTVNPKED